MLLFLRFLIHQRYIINQSPPNERPKKPIQNKNTSNSKNPSSWDSRPHPFLDRAGAKKNTQNPDRKSEQRIGDSVCIISMSCGEFDDETNGRKKPGGPRLGVAKRLANSLQVLKYTLTEISCSTNKNKVNK